MDRVYNFSAGPAMLPEEVLREAKKSFAKLPTRCSIIKEAACPLWK